MDTELPGGEQREQQNSEKLFQELDSYNWDDDSGFQGGLSAILGPSPTASQVETLTLRARCFYFSRKKSLSPPIDFEAYKTWHFTRNPHKLHSSTPSQTVTITSSDPGTTDSGETPPYPTSFADLVALITTGVPIPGIKDIPTTLLTSQATQPQASKRRKPWETDGHVVEKVESSKEGTFGDGRDRVITQEFPEGEL